MADIKKTLVKNYKHKNCIGSVIKVVNELTDGLDGIYLDRETALAIDQLIGAVSKNFAGPLKSEWELIKQFEKEVNGKYRKTSSPALSKTNP